MWWEPSGAASALFSESTLVNLNFPISTRTSATKGGDRSEETRPDEFKDQTAWTQRNLPVIPDAVGIVVWRLLFLAWILLGLSWGLYRQSLLDI
jgi:hypothetical protein